MDIIAGMPDMQKVENSLSKARRMMAMDQFAKRTKELFILSFKENGNRNDWIFLSLLIGRISTYKKDDEMTWSRIIWRQALNLWIQTREVDNPMTGKDEPKKGFGLT